MSLEAQLAAYLGALWNEPVEISGVARIPGGASRETFRFDARAPSRGEVPLILRRDPTASLIDTDRKLEYAAYRSFSRKGVPIPELVALEEVGGPLERPFFLMMRVEGGAAAGPFTPDPYGEHAAAVGRSFFAILGRIAAEPVAGLPIAEVAKTPAPEACWSRELAVWEEKLDRDELHPQPIARAAIRWLRRNPPPKAQKLSVVHGDYRSGNFLHDGKGRILAILDWEMAHIGDPLEDLAWAMDPLWGHFDASRVSGMAPRADALAWWEEASGLTADPAALDWWALFSALKGLVIWVSAAKAYRDGGGRDPVLGFSGWYCGRRHDLILAELLQARLDAGARAA